MKKKPKSKLNPDNEKNRNHTTKPYTKCSKMSEEAAENFEVKNGISNGSVLSSKQHHQPQQPFRMHQKSPEHLKSNEYQKQLQSSNNSNSNSSDNHVNGTKSSNVGGRLQFFKDGKFILELARSRGPEGEKQGWISVPRKTFWPPTITANSSKTFSKHESSTSLSYSDDNSSVQSSPWQRDHCWKQTQPRQNISIEMSFFFHKPAILHFSKETKEMMQLKRRRPQDKSFGVYKVIEAEKGSKNSTKSNDPQEPLKADHSGSIDVKIEATQEINSMVETKNDPSRPLKCSKKLENILKTLSDRRLQDNSPPYSKSNNGNSTSHNISNYSILSHLQQNNLSYNNVHQHVSPRKRILREFEKVSLEDSVMKRLKQKQSQQVAATTIVQASIPNQKFLNNFSNGNEISTINHTQNVSAAIGTIASKQQPPTPISRPISSYSITSLLGHNNNKKSGMDDSILDKNTLNKNSKDSAYPSHCQRYSKEYDCAQQRISLITPQSPIYTQADHKIKPVSDDKLKTQNNFSTFASSSRVTAKTLNLSSSPEHHAFQKYRPSHETISNSPSSPYNYHHSASAIVTTSSPSSSDVSRGRGATVAAYKSSPKRSFASTAATPSSGLHETSSALYKSRHSPQYKDNSRDSSLSPSALQSKGTSLHRQSPCFSSPSAADAKLVGLVKDENALNLTDLKPRAKNALIRPTTPLSQLHHPTASHGMYYMYPPGYLHQSVSSYYHSFYNSPVAYRNPLYMQYPTHPSAATLYDENLNNTSSNSSMMNRLGYVPMTNPWNPIPLTTHSIDDGNLIDNKMKDESSTSDLPLNLSKH